MVLCCNCNRLPANGSLPTLSPHLQGVCTRKSCTENTAVLLGDEKPVPPPFTRHLQGAIECFFFTRSTACLPTRETKGAGLRCPLSAGSATATSFAEYPLRLALKHLRLYWPRSLTIPWLRCLGDKCRLTSRPVVQLGRQVISPTPALSGIRQETRPNTTPHIHQEPWAEPRSSPSPSPAANRARRHEIKRPIPDHRPRIQTIFQKHRESWAPTVNLISTLLLATMTAHGVILAQAPVSVG